MIIGRYRGEEYWGEKWQVFCDKKQNKTHLLVNSPDFISTLEVTPHNQVLQVHIHHQANQVRSLVYSNIENNLTNQHSINFLFCPITIAYLISTIQGSNKRCSTQLALLRYHFDSL